MKCECGKEIPVALASNRAFYAGHIDDPVGFRDYYIKDFGEEEYQEFLEEYEDDKNTLDEVNRWFWQIEIPLGYTCECGKTLDVYFNREENEMYIREPDCSGYDTPSGIGW